MRLVSSGFAVLRSNAAAIAAFAAFGLTVMQLVLTAPLLLDFYFVPNLSIGPTGTFLSDQTAFELRNDGSAEANNVIVEFDAFVKLEDVISRPDIGVEVKHKPDGGLSLRYPLLRADEIVMITLHHVPVSSDDETFKIFGTTYPYFLRSDEVTGRVIYPEPLNE